MNCIDYHELISAYIDDELSEGDTRKLLHHLEQCRDCTNELRMLTLQRQQVATLGASVDSPTPDPDFSRTVMAVIDQVSLPEISPIRRFFEGLIEELLLPVRKPAVALPLLLLLIAGTVTGVYLRSLPNTSQLKMVSVYDVAAAQSNSGRNQGTAPLAEEVELHLFDHFADTSTETFAAKPCLLEYASYRCTSEVEDY